MSDVGFGRPRRALECLLILLLIFGVTIKTTIRRCFGEGRVPSYSAFTIPNSAFG